ncbi:MAG: aldehyde dehydrogenase family protein [Holophagales bacterium]|nr:aldehyde dehydrogenase family protein [Holophagales bacterium]
MTSRNIPELLRRLGIDDVCSGAFDGEWLDTRGELLESYDPTTGERLAAVRQATSDEYERVAAKTVEAFRAWREWPAPKRGEVVRPLGDALREHKEDLGKLVTVEMGKILSEGLGEVQEMIDMADLAVGMSRQLYGLTMHSERYQHRMYEQWHPLGPVGIITAFNFPVAVWAWNATVAAVAGDSMIWKPSEYTPLTAIATTRIAQQVLERNDAPPIFNLVIGDRIDVGEHMVKDPRLPLISATGSVPMGRRVGALVAERLGRSLLELGGNNGLIVMDDADLDLAFGGILFGAVGTAGQRCTTTRRLLLHESISGELLGRLLRAYPTIRIGDPLDPETLMGPLIHRGAVDAMQKALSAAVDQGGEVLYGGEPIEGPGDGAGHFVKPAIVKVPGQVPITCDETFAPILYAIEFSDLDEAIDLHNAVPQGLSSSIFTLSMRNAERFLAHAGSDCGIANVNIGTSGAEIGGAFGGEKETGGGREAGSDAWKTYMRRQTNTLNWSPELPLAQGVEFDL